MRLIEEKRIGKHYCHSIHHALHIATRGKKVDAREIKIDKMSFNLFSLSWSRRKFVSHRLSSANWTKIIAIVCTALITVDIFDVYQHIVGTHSYTLYSELQCHVQSINQSVNITTSRPSGGARICRLGDQ